MNHSPVTPVSSAPRAGPAGTGQHPVPAGPARGALLTGVTGLWFIASLWGRRPLAYLFSQPLLEGRFRWPRDWDGLWDRSPRFRRMWRNSSLLWGIGTLIDAALRVVMAYT